MIYELNDHQILSLMQIAAKTAVSEALTELGLKKSQVSQREAFKRFGESNVRRWRRDGRVNPVKKGGVTYYPVSEMEAMRNINELYEKHFTNEREQKAR